MRKTSINIPDCTYRKAHVAAASAGLCVSELIRDALDTALVAFAENDTALSTYFRLMDSGDSQLTAERERILA